jgi:ribosomal protein L15E
MRKKGYDQEYFCEVIIVKCKHQIIKDEYESKDIYNWLDIEKENRHNISHLFDNRENN